MGYKLCCVFFGRVRGRRQEKPIWMWTDMNKCIAENKCECECWVCVRACFYVEKNKTKKRREEKEGGRKEVGDLVR